MPTPVEKGHRDCSVVPATMAMDITAASVSAETDITDASHAIFSNLAGGITPESNPVEIASAGSFHDVTGGFSNESAALVVESFALDPSTAARPGPSSGLSTCDSIALVAADRSSSGFECMACGYGSMTADRSRSGSECMACGYGSMTAARSSSGSESVACGYGSTMVALETLDTEGILSRGLFVAGSGVLLLGTSSSGIISLLLGWLLDMLYEML